MPHAHAQNTELELVYFFLGAAFFLVADFFLGAAFLAGDFLTGFLAADFLAAAGFCDGGSGGPTSVQVDHALTWAMRRRAHAGMHDVIRARNSGRCESGAWRMR